jgi:catechol 2,3-dioxygenase-like lactoylglutathione lyase family enzyme
VNSHPPAQIDRRFSAPDSRTTPWPEAAKLLEEAELYWITTVRADGRTPEPGGWNRIHFVVEDIAAEVERLRAAGLTFRNDIVSGPGGQQILLEDRAGNPIELFQPAGA